MTEDRGLMVAEVFGPTCQGEGPNLGRRCGFVRLGMCNLNCTWCDTPYTWDWTRFDRKKEMRRWSPVEVLEAVTDMGVNRVVVTGGEPLVQRVQLVGLAGLLKAAGFFVEVETNGTIHPDGLVDTVGWWNVSPKLTHSGVPHERAWKPAVLRELAKTDRAAFKFVCREVGDLAEIADLCALSGVQPEQVWVMPEGRSHEALASRLPELTEGALAYSYNVTTRLHVEVWGDTRGH